MALGSNIKYQLEAVFSTAYDPKSAKQVEQMYNQLSKRVAESSRAEFVTAFKEFGNILNGALQKLNIQPINIEKIIELPQAQMFSQLGSEFGTKFAEGFNGAISGSGNNAIQEQIKALEQQRARLEKQQKVLPQRLKRYEMLSELEVVEKGDIKGFSSDEIKKMSNGKTANELAAQLRSEYDASLASLEKLDIGTKEYYQTLITTYEAALKLYQMRSSMDKNPKLITNKDVLFDYDYDSLQAAVGDQLVDGGHADRFAKYIEKQSNYLDNIPKSLVKINTEIANIQAANPDIVNKTELDNGLKSLNEIEAAYKRILNAKGKVGKQGKNIDAALNFDTSTSTKGIATLYKEYNEAAANSPWEVEYQALLKYVKLYESYLNSSNEVHRKKAQNPEFKALYDQLKPMQTNAENMLRNVLNMANNIPLVGMGGTNKEATVTVAPEVQNPIDTPQEVTGGKAEIEVPVKPVVEGGKEAAKVIQDIMSNASQNEKFAYLNTKAGQASDYIVGAKMGAISKSERNNLLQSSGNAQLFDSTIHTHLTKLAAPSTDDISVFVNNFENFKKNFILAGEQLASIDFSSLSAEQVKKISSVFSQKAASIDEFFGSSHVSEFSNIGNNITQKLLDFINNDLLSKLLSSMQSNGIAESDGQKIITSYSAKIKEYFASVDLTKTTRDDFSQSLGNIAKSVLSTYPEKTQMALRSSLGGLTSLEFDQISGAFDKMPEMVQQQLSNMFVETLNQLKLNTSDIFKTYKLSDFDFKSFTSKTPSITDKVDQTKKEAQVRQENTAAINSEVQAQKQLNTAKSQEPKPVDDTPQLETENKKLDEQNNKLKENNSLKNQNNGTPVITRGTVATGTTGTTSTPSTPIPSGVVAREATELEAVRSKVVEVTAAINTKNKAFYNEGQVVGQVIGKENSALISLKSNIDAITSAVNTKTQAFFYEQSAVKRVAQSEIYALSEVEKKVTTIQTILKNIKSGKSVVGANLNDIVVTVNNSGNNDDMDHLSIIENTLSTILLTVESINSKILPGTKGSTGSKAQSSAATTYKGTTKDDYRGSTYFPEKLKTQTMYLAKFRAELMTSGKLTDELDNKIYELLMRLSQIKNGPDLSVWSEQFKQLRTSVGINTIFENYDDKATITSYKELISLQKMRNQLELQYEKAKDGSAVKQFYQDQLTLMGNMIANQQIINKNDEYENKLIQMQAEHQRKLGEVRARKVDQAKETADNEQLKEQQKTISNLISLYKEYGTLRERAKSLAGSNQAVAVQDAADAKLQEIFKIRAPLNVTSEMEDQFNNAYNQGINTEFQRQYEAMGKAMDSEESARIRELTKDYEKLGQIRAQADRTTGANERQVLRDQVDLLEQNIKTKQQGLNINQAFFDTKQMDAYNKKLDEINRKEAQRKDKDITKANQAFFNAAIKDSQKQAGVKKADSVTAKAGETLNSAMAIDGITPDRINMLQQYKASIESLKGSVEQVRQNGVADDAQKQKLIQQTSAVNQQTKAVQELISNYERLSGENAIVIGKDTLGMSATADQYYQQLTNIVQAQNKGRVTIKGYNADTKTLTYTLKTGKGEFTEYTASVRQADGALVAVRGSTKKAMGVIDSIAMKAKQFSYYFTGSMMIYRVIGWVREGITAVKDIDLALTELRKVTDETEESYDKFLDTASKTAAKVGSTTKEIISSTADWARLNI